jgi:hypothetical protein
MTVVKYIATLIEAMVMKATIIPSAAIQSLITHVQIHAMSDFRQDIVTMSSPESWLYQQCDPCDSGERPTSL